MLAVSPKLRGQIRRALRGTPGAQDMRRLAAAILAEDPVHEGERLSHWLGIMRQERDPHWLAFNQGIYALRGAGPMLLPVWLDRLYREEGGHLTWGGLIWMAAHPHPAALPALKRALEGERAALRFRALGALEALTPLPSGFIPKIIELAGGGSEREAFLALRILRWQGLDPGLTQPIFERALGHAGEQARRAAALGLGALGEQAASSLPALQAALRAARRGRDYRIEAAIGQIQPDLVLPGALEALLGKRTWSQNAHALYVMSRIDCRAALDRLVSESSKSWAVAALGQMGADAAPALPHLRDRLAQISGVSFDGHLLYGAIRDIERGARFPPRFIGDRAPRSSASPRRLLSGIASRGAERALDALQALAYEAAHLWDECYPLDLPPRCQVEALERWRVERTQRRRDVLSAESGYNLTQGTCSNARGAVRALDLIAYEAPKQPGAALSRVYEVLLEALSASPGLPLYQGDAFDPPPAHITAAYLAYVLEQSQPR